MKQVVTYEVSQKGRYDLTNMCAEKISRIKCQLQFQNASYLGGIRRVIDIEYVHWHTKNTQNPLPYLELKRWTQNLVMNKASKYEISFGWLNKIPNENARRLFPQFPNREYKLMKSTWMFGISRKWFS